MSDHQSLCQHACPYTAGLRFVWVGQASSLQKPLGPTSTPATSTTSHDSQAASQHLRVAKLNSASSFDSLTSSADLLPNLFPSLRNFLPPAVDASTAARGDSHVVSPPSHPNDNTQSSAWAAPLAVEHTAAAPYLGAPAELPFAQCQSQQPLTNLELQDVDTQLMINSTGSWLEDPGDVDDLLNWAAPDSTHPQSTSDCSVLGVPAGLPQSLCHCSTFDCSALGEPAATAEVIFQRCMYDCSALGEAAATPQSLCQRSTFDCSVLGAPASTPQSRSPPSTFDCSVLGKAAATPYTLCERSTLGSAAAPASSGMWSPCNSHSTPSHPSGPQHEAMLGLDDVLLPYSNSLTSSLPAPASDTGTNPPGEQGRMYALQQYGYLTSRAPTQCQLPPADPEFTAVQCQQIHQSSSQISTSAPHMPTGPHDPHQCNLMQAASSGMVDELVNALLPAPDADDIMLADAHEDDMLLSDMCEGGMLMGETCASSASQSDASWLLDRWPCCPHTDVNLISLLLTALMLHSILQDMC